jgi:hypothetical protein
MTAKLKAVRLQKPPTDRSVVPHRQGKSCRGNPVFSLSNYAA